MSVCLRVVSVSLSPVGFYVLSVYREVFLLRGSRSVWKSGKVVETLMLADTACVTCSPEIFLTSMLC